MSRILTATSLALALGATTHAAPASPPSHGPLKSKLDRIVSRPELAHSQWGIRVQDLGRGATLYSLNDSLSLTPASTLKLATTAAALDAYGPNAEISTTVETAARVDNAGRVLGDVFLVGRGDPMIWGTSAECPITGFDRLADQLVAAGVKRIEGRLIGHEGAFTGSRRAVDWGWADLMWYYGADVSALVFNNSAVNFRVAPGERVDDPVSLDGNPRSAYYKVVVTAKTAAPESKPDLIIDRPLGSNVVYFGGTLPQGGAAEDLFVSMEDPALFAATVFAETLEAHGIRVRGPIETSRGALPSESRALATLTSARLAEIVRQVNQPSHNLRAEMLLRLVGLRARGEGSAEAGIGATKDFLARQGVSLDGWALHDGCGLAASNLVTASGLVALLASMSRHQHATAFKDSLALAGVDGTLKHRFVGTPSERRLRAKSGAIRQTYALAGYADGRHGEPLAFAILLNHFVGESAVAYTAINDICDVLVTH
jgi:D-alanyl-D-alanine carboxypeptidase/D-alanyl-D-alanine-endopeptidase (penicillin-binding protein 4)